VVGYAAWQRRWGEAAKAGLGCLVILAPWWTRNWLVAGHPFPGGGLKTLWLRDYDEMFWPGAELSLGRYLAWGLGPILASKFHSGLYNLYVLAGGPWPGLGPLAVLGMVQLRRDPRIRLALLYGLGLWLAMTVAFTFPAVHGTTFHSGSALVVFQAVCLPRGIAEAVSWLKRWLRWDTARFTRYFLVRLTAIAVAFSLVQYGLIWLRIIRPELTAAGWISHRVDHYLAVDRALDAMGVPAQQPIIVRDPPSFYYATGRWAVALPYNSQLLDVIAERYDARCAVLEDAGIERVRRALRAGLLPGWEEVMMAR